MSDPRESETWIQVEFMDAYLADQEAGGNVPLTEYLRRYPGHEPAILAAWKDLEARTRTEVTPIGRSTAAPGRWLGPYRLDRELGRGGQAMVFAAEDSRLGRRVALKILTSPLGPGTEEQLRRFRREAAVTSRLEHPAICTIYEADVAAGIGYIAMRYVEGRTLADIIQACRSAPRDDPSTMVTLPEDGTAPETPAKTGSKGALSGRRSLPRVLRLIEAAARALHVAHEAGVIHRDVKPGNLMVTPDGSPVVLDFGLAGDERDVHESLTRTGEMFGTPAYMSPEQVEGRPLDRRTDVFSLGATLYECLTLQRPFERATRQELYDAIRTAAPPDARRLNPVVSADLKVVLLTALEKDPMRRYQTTLDFAEDLRAVIERRPIEARRPSAATRLWIWARREPAKATLAAVLCIAVPGIAGLAGYIAAKAPEIEAHARDRREKEIERLVETGYLEMETGRRSSRDAEVSAAEEAFRAALALDPERPEALLGLASMWEYDGRATEAVKLLEPHARDPVFRRSWIEVLRAAGRTVEADALAGERLPPAGPLALFIDGAAELGRGHRGDARAYVKAQDLFARAVAVAEKPRLLFHSAWAHAAMHAEDERTILICAEALERQWPDSPMAWFWIGLTTAGVDPERSIAAWLVALELKPDSGDACFNLGQVLMQQGRRAEAEKRFREAVAIDPKFAEAHFHLAQLHLEQHDLESAAAAIDQAIALEPDRAIYHQRKAQVLAQAGRHDEAVLALDRAVVVDATSGEAHRGRGNLLDWLGRHQEAVVSLTRAAALAPLQPRVHLDLVAALKSAGDTEGLGRELERWAKAHPGDREAQVAWAGFCLRGSGEHVDEERALAAAAALKTAVEATRRQDPELLHHLARALRSAGDDEQALGIAKEAMDLLESSTTGHEELRAALERTLRELREEIRGD